MWARVAVGGFYRSVQVDGDISRFQGRPAVIAVNHSNALGDIALLLGVLPQFPRFLAASTWWRSAPARLLFRLGRVLPVERRGDGAAGDRNGATFAACHDALAAADHIAIFPEGELNSGAALLRFRTGAARIALSAAIDVGVQGVVIVPVALAYEDRGRLGSDVAVRVGAPIDTDDWVGQFREDPVGTARAVTDLLQERLADAHSLATSELVAAGATPMLDRNHRMGTLALLAPVAAAGAVANAAVVVPIALGTRFVGDEGWQATAKAVAATALLPVSWIVSGHLLARRWGVARAVALVAAGAGSGWVSLVWLGLLRSVMRPMRDRPVGADRIGSNVRDVQAETATSGAGTDSPSRFTASLRQITWGRSTGS